MRILNENEDLNEIIKEGKYLLDFYADWCGPCKMLAPILEEIEGIDIIKINVDLHKEIAVKYGVMSIPTLIVTENGTEIKKDIGFKTKEELEDFIK